MFNLTDAELRTLRPLNTPRKVQDFLNVIPANFGLSGDTCLSPRRVLELGLAHCVEGALLAALALRLQGHRPLVVDLTAVAHDQDHVIAIFKQYEHWGAISKTNHAVLRYREPIYRTIHELVMSYFHEYTDDHGRKTLRSYTRLVDLKRFDARGWMTSDEDVWYVPEYLADIPHIPLLTRAQIAGLRRADDLECQAGELVQWKSPTHHQ